MNNNFWSSSCVWRRFFWSSACTDVGNQLENSRSEPQ